MLRQVGSWSGRPSTATPHRDYLSAITRDALDDERSEVVIADIRQQGTALLASRLGPDRVLTVWSAARSSSYERVLARHFRHVEVVEIPVPRGEPDVVFAAAEPVAQTQGRDSDSR